MKIFITGATGYLGQRLALDLAGEGHILHVLARNTKNARRLLNHERIYLFEGDILDSDSIKKAMMGCEQVYHLAALASVWNRDPNAFHLHNVEGLKNVLECSLRLNIKGLVFTSTAGVVGHSDNGRPVKEYSNSSPSLETLYEKSKVEAENLLKTYVEKGLRAVIVNPSRVYGPGILTESNGFTRLIQMYIGGHWKIRPNKGESVGNYVFIDDIINGLKLAMIKAKPGERYLMGGIDVSFNGFLSLVDQLEGTQRKLMNLPLPFMLMIAHLQIGWAYLTGIQPLISPPFVRKYNKHWRVCSQKAESEFGYSITPLDEGIRKTLAWLKESSDNYKLN